MQPQRDPEDVRYWPQKDGGTGFHRGPGNPRYQYSALRDRDQHRNLVTDHTVTLPSIVAMSADVPQDYTPDTVRSRARAALVLAIKRASDTLSDEANELKLNELAPTMAALGRISGVAVEEQKTGDIRIHIVRDQPPPSDATPPHALREVAPAKDIGTHDLASPDAMPALPASTSSHPHVSREVGDVSVCDDARYVIEDGR